MVSHDIYAPRDSDNELQARIRAAAAAIKKQSDDYWNDPYGNTCGLGFPHVVGPHVYKRGGFANCLIAVKLLR